MAGTDEERTAPPSARRRGAIGVAAVALVAGLLGGGLASAGFATFTDVPPEHPFYEDIEAIAAAGITGGYPDGGYHPSEPVTRQAMAAFMHRGFGRAAFDEGGLATTTDALPVEVASVDVTAGAAGGGTGGYVVLTGTGTNSTADDNCSCDLGVQIRDEAELENSEVAADSAESPETPQSALVRMSATAVAVFPIDAGETKTFALRLTPSTAGINVSNLRGQLHAVYVPFDGTGNDPVVPE